MSDMSALLGAPRPLLVLNMIVKNEERVIDRCLDAVLPHVDAWVISSNGTDRTRELIQRAAERHNKTGLLLEDPWVNFGINRTRAVGFAKQWLQDIGVDPKDVYLLTIDADMLLVVSEEFSREQLTEPLYELWQVNSSLRYKNRRLLRLSADWVSMGPTHEYWASIPDVPSQLLTTMMIEDRDDGGSRDDKLERDIRLLEEDLERHPDNERTVFYLAEGYFASGQYMKAADLYARRSTMGGFGEEAWYARYKQGLSLLNLATPPKAHKMLTEAFAAVGHTVVEPPVNIMTRAQAVGLLMESYQERPWRAEPLMALATHYRCQGQHQLAFMLASYCSTLARPDDSLFVSEHAHTSGPLEEMAISAYYLGHRELGMKCCEQVLAMRGLHWHEHSGVANNQLFYLEKELKVLRRGRFQVPTILRKFHDGEPALLDDRAIVYETSSPTIISHWARQPSLGALRLLTDEHGGKRPLLLVNVRLVNYDHERGLWFCPKDGTSVSRTENIVMEFHDWNIENPTPSMWLSPAVVPEEWPKTRIRGFEDQRWIHHDGRIWFTSSCAQIPGQDYPQVVLCRWDEELEKLDKILPLTFVGEDGATKNNPVEKNWIPWSHEDVLYVIYFYDPFTVLRVDEDTGVCRAVKVQQPEWCATRWRGGTPLVKRPVIVGGRLVCRYLMLIHEVVNRANDNVYLHRWVEIDPDLERGFAITRYSRPFSFHHHGVEYAAGLVRTFHGTMIVTYGAEERESHWVEIDERDIEDALSVDDSR